MASEARVARAPTQNLAARLASMLAPIRNAVYTGHREEAGPFEDGEEPAGAPDVAGRDGARLTPLC